MDATCFYNNNNNNNNNNYNKNYNYNNNQGRHRITTWTPSVRTSPLSMRRCRRPKGLHGLSCKRMAGRSTRHRSWTTSSGALSDEPTFQHSRYRQAWFRVPTCRKPRFRVPTCVLTAWPLFRGNGKYYGRCLAWDATVVDTLAMSYLSPSSTDIGSSAKAAAERKTAKYSDLSYSHIFIPVAVETLGPINEAGDSFLAQVGKLYHPSLMTPGDILPLPKHICHHSAV